MPVEPEFELSAPLLGAVARACIGGALDPQADMPQGERDALSELGNGLMDLVEESGKRGWKPVARLLTGAVIALARECRTAQRAEHLIEIQRGREEG